MARDDFKHAAQAFEKANQYIPDFRDSLHMAELARSFVPPNQNELKRIIQHSVTHGIPLNWLHDEHRGVTEEVRITHVRVIRQGRFNHHRQFWPYRLRVQGKCELELSEKEERMVQFDSKVDFRMFRNDFGEWEAHFRK